MATPLSSAPPLFAPVHPDPTKDSGKDTEGTSANPEKASGEEQAEQKAEEIATKKSKAPARFRVQGEMVALHHRYGTEELGSGRLSASRKLANSSGFLDSSPSGCVLAISNHVTLCEGHLRVTPELPLFQYYFTVKKEKIRQTFELATCGSITFMLRPGRVYPHTDRHESARYWSGSFFYLKDVSDPASDRKLPLFKNSPASETPSWTQCPHLSESPLLTRAVRRICKLTEEGLSGKDLTILGLLTKLEALDKGELGTLFRVPHSGNNDPEAASEAEVPDAPRLTKRKKAAPSSPAAKRAREAPSIAATCKAEAEKKRLKLIDTSNRAQPNIQQFFIPTSKSSGSQAPRFAKKKVKPFPASIPVTPEVEVPPKASSAAKSDPKDVINVDDLPEDPIAETDKGNSGKGSSSSAPPPEQPTATSTEVPTDLVEQKLRLSGATGTPQTHPHFFPILQKKQEIELLQTRDADNQKAIALLETRIKGFEDDIAKRPSIDSLSAKIEVLQAENESLKKFLKESSEEETKKRKELLEKHAQELSDLAEKLKKGHQWIQTLAAKNKKYEEEAEAIDKMIFPSLGFEWTKETALKRTEAYEEVQSSIDNLFEACRGVAKSLSLKRAETAGIDTMTKLIKQVPELIKDWQESSARGVASLVLATCKAHFPTMNFADVSRGTPKSANMRALLAETEGGAVLELFLGEVHLLQSLQVHDVHASSAIHKAFGEVIPVYAGTYNQSVALFGDDGRVIRPVKGTAFSDHLTSAAQP
ncbi:hypothetical protein QYE76_051088 [Lolium multiflorum]|uniref:Uncharacterized protein n=1 Tax=Lolium multiflorum TaxID=4521 RepID=A0AAD8SS12_LOLMU|nr:hypothetical protein QYE76_051088 [Lolium multiflorum]